MKRGGLWGFVGAALGLVLLEGAVTNKGGPQAVSGAFGILARFASWWVSPTTPGIPQRSASSTSSIPSFGSYVFGAPAPGSTQLT